MMAHVCGIAGFDRERCDVEAITDRLTEGLRHRGPDSSSASASGPWQLVQTRLAVIDLSDRVTYPMRNEAGNLHLVFNGEIYEHQQLRRVLERLGHAFQTDCDAEVIVHGWEEWGPEVLGRLNGMFALAIADDTTGELVLARDRLGIKPLARTVGGRFAFASDCLELVEAGLASNALDPVAIDEFLAFHYVPGPRTGLRDVRQVEPGTLVRRRGDGTETIERWADPSFRHTDHRRIVELEEADQILADSVARQLVADVDVGVLLSSGLDSALVLAYARRAGATPVALTIGFPSSGDYDESADARRIARHFDTPHHVRTLDVGFHEAISAIQAAHDMPIADPSCIATAALSKLASEHATVVLSGTGGDDLFAGYYRHRLMRTSQLLDRAPASLRRRLASTSSGRGGERQSQFRLARSYATRLAQASLLDPHERYLSLVASSTSAVGRGAVRHRDGRDAAVREVAARHGFNPSSDSLVTLDDIQSFELQTYLPDDLLVKEDRSLMLHGVEGRVPLLDNAMLELAMRTPPHQRATMLKGKRLLRQVAAVTLPRGLISGRKRGFAVPLEPLLRGPWREAAKEWLEASNTELVDGGVAAGLVGTAPALDVWALSALAAWDAKRLAAGSASPVPA